MSSDSLTSSTSSSKARRSIASFKTMFTSKKNLIDQSSAPASPLESTVDSPESSPSISPVKSQGSVASKIASNSKRAMGKAASVVVPDKEHVQVDIPLSIVDEHGAFLPPPPVDKGFKEHVTENDIDVFQAIISTPPERMRTILSAASTISPGMFSSASSKIKRHSLVSFPSNISFHQHSRSSHEFADDEGSSSPSSARTSSSLSSSPVKRDRRVQMSEGDSMEDDLNAALSESMTGSMMASFVGPSSPSQESVPELMDDDDDPSASSGSESLASSANASPRHSTTSLFQRPFVKRKALREVSLDIEMPLAH